MLCNQKIKFDVFLNYARQVLGVDAVATGHYVRSSAGNFLDRIDEKPVSELKLKRLATDPLILHRPSDDMKPVFHFLLHVLCYVLTDQIAEGRGRLQRSVLLLE